jgi:hypothetical protein
VVQDEKYQVVLQADSKTLAGFVERYKDAPHGMPVSFVYVFVIDSEGRGQLIFPKLRDNGVVNRLPAAMGAEGMVSLPAEIPVSDLLTIDAPFGVDSYLLLTTAGALGNPDVLNFEGPGASRGARGLGDNDALSHLLGGLGEGSRGVRIPAPTDWSIQRTFIRSIAK